MSYTVDEQELYDWGKGSIPKFLFEEERAEEVMGAYVKMFDAARAAIATLFEQTYILNATGTGPKYLDQHAWERVGSRREDETDVALRERIRTVQDALVRSYLLQIAQGILDADGVSGDAEMVELRRDKAYLGTFGPIDIVWTDKVNVTATGNDLEKTGGSGGSWDAGATSTRVITRNGYVEFRLGSTSDTLMCGLSYGSAGEGYAEIDFAIYHNYNAGAPYLQIYENGVGVTSGLGTASVDDVLRVKVDEDGTVTYWKNDTLLYTSTEIPTYPLLVDCSINNTNGKIVNARICHGGLGLTGGVGGVFTKPATQVQRFEPYDLPWARPPYDERPPDYGWRLTTSGADNANNDGTFSIKAMYGDAAEFINTPGVADSEDLGVEWKTEKVDQDSNLADGYARAFVDRGYRVSGVPPSSAFVIILPYGTSAETAASVEEAVRQRKAAGFKLIVERRLNP